MKNTTQESVKGTTQEPKVSAENVEAMKEKGLKDKPSDLRSIHINIDEEGKMGMDFKGSFKIHEAFGMLVVSLIDLGAKNFLAPYFQNLSKTVQEHGVDKDDVKDIAQFNESASQIIKLVEAFKSVK
jgi:hypothetical protein